MSDEQIHHPREAVEGAITALAGNWSESWLDSLRAAARLLPEKLEWEEKYALKERVYRLRTVHIDAERTVGVGKADDGSFLVLCTRPEPDGTEHVERMALSDMAMLALMYLYAKLEDIPLD